MTFVELSEKVETLAFTLLGIASESVTDAMNTMMNAVAMDAIMFTAQRRGVAIDTEDVDSYFVNNQYLMAQLASSAYNKIGVNGQTSHNENGVHRVYDSSAYPADLVARIVPLVRTYGATESESTTV